MDTNYPEKPIEVTDENFNGLVKKYDVLVVDCWAEWCGPCRMLGPIIEQLSTEMHGKAVFGKLNVDSNNSTASDYEISAIPTLLVFKKGKLVDRIVGLAPKDMIEQKLEKII